MSISLKNEEKVLTFCYENNKKEKRSKKGREANIQTMGH